MCINRLFTQWGATKNKKKVMFQIKSLCEQSKQ